MCMNPDTDSTGSSAYEMFLNCSVPLNGKNNQNKSEITLLEL